MLVYSSYMLHKSLRRFGVLKTGIVLTAMAILISVGITLLITFIEDGYPSTNGIFIAILVPAVVSPIFGFITLNLVNRLDKAEQRLQRLAYTDDLTHAPNRRYFMELLEQEVNHARSSGGIFSIAILDMDNFKTINDRYGHHVGDQVLCALSRRCGQCLRPADIFARFGGDEFILLFPDTGLQNARVCMQRVFSAITAPLMIQGIQITPSSSFGVAAFDRPDITLDDLIRQADDAMYQAKRSGGNRIFYAEIPCDIHVPTL